MKFDARPTNVSPLSRRQIELGLKGSARVAIAMTRSYWASIFALRALSNIAKSIPPLQLVIRALLMLPVFLFLLLVRPLREWQLRQVEDHLTVNDMRLMFETLERPPLVHVSRWLQPKVDVQTVLSSNDIPIHVYAQLARPNQTLDTIVYHIHGGASIACSPRSYEGVLKIWAKRLKVPVVSIDYSLSPEARYPVALNECVHVFKELNNGSSSLNREIATACGFENVLSSVRIIMVGDSAGGNLGAATCIRLLDEDHSLPAGLVLVYPSVNRRISKEYPSATLYENDVMIPKVMRTLYITAYVGPDSVDASDPCLSPICAKDAVLKRFPPTKIVVGSHDPLRDESRDFYSKLVAARNLQVGDSFQELQGLPHAFLNLSTLSLDCRRGEEVVQDLLRDFVKQSSFSVLNSH